jgi:RNA polymerase sigma factor (sigma-70 family)
MNADDAEHRQRDFTELFIRYHADVLAYCRRRLKAGTADDAVADTFMAAWRTFDSRDGDPRLWLLGIARGAVANSRRGTERRGSLQLRARASTLRIASPDHGENVGWDDTFHTAFARLSAADQELLRLVSWEGLDAEGVAAVLGCSIGAANVRLHRARHRLRRLLDAAEHEPSDAAGDRHTGGAPPPGRISSSQTKEDHA